MHKSHSISIVFWVDKKLVFILSTHKKTIANNYKHVFVDNKVIHVEISPIHVKYPTYVRCCNVANQLVGQHSVQSRSHKQWHRPFCWLLDVTTVDMWKLHKEICEAKGWIPYLQLEFKLRLGRTWWVVGRLGRNAFPHCLHMCSNCA